MTPTPLDYGRPEPRRPWPRRLRWIAVIAIGLAVGLAAAFILISVLPDTPHSPAAAQRARCLSNLNQINTAIQLYMVDHGNVYPDTSADLYAAEPDMGSLTFVCPASTDMPAVEPTTRANAAAIAAGGHCSYVYVGRGLTQTTAGPATVVAYEPLSNHGDGCHVLYGDGHVAWQSAPPTTAPAR